MAEKGAHVLKLDNKQFIYQHRKHVLCINNENLENTMWTKVRRRCNSGQQLFKRTYALMS